MERIKSNASWYKMIHFCYDTMSNANLGYPNLAKLNLDPDAFDREWPRCIPFRLLVYFNRAGVNYSSSTVDLAPIGSWYPVALGWHDFDCDYFKLMSLNLINRLKKSEIRVLFYYHEGDNPYRIKDRLDYLCNQHQLPSDCYIFISANSVADNLDQFYYFPDHEHFLKYINRRQGHIPVTDIKRKYNFTALNRIHKWWRASCMADLHHLGILSNSLWSYNTTCTIDDAPENNPLQVYNVKDWADHINTFLSNGPYFCDGPDTNVHNDHRIINSELYTNSYCHIVLETLFDVDQSNGAFITEKTYKCIKFGQPFVIVGGAGSLQTLRNAGFRTFDHAMDNSYDFITDNTQRWFAIKRTLEQIKSQDLYQWFLKCLPDIEHNQNIYNQNRSISLNRLINQLNYKL